MLFYQCIPFQDACQNPVFLFQFVFWVGRAIMEANPDNCKEREKDLMNEKHFDLTEDTLPVVEEIGGHMPGGFFIYNAKEPEELIYANKPVFDIFGCADLAEFKALTGFTFRGMVHPEDYGRITASIAQQICASED